MKDLKAVIKEIKQGVEFLAEGIVFVIRCWVEAETEVSIKKANKRKRLKY